MMMVAPSQEAQTHDIQQAQDQNMLDTQEEQPTPEAVGCPSGPNNPYSAATPQEAASRNPYTASPSQVPAADPLSPWQMPPADRAAANSLHNVYDLQNTQPVLPQRWTYRDHSASNSVEWINANRSGEEAPRKRGIGGSSSGSVMPELAKRK